MPSLLTRWRWRLRERSAYELVRDRVLRAVLPFPPALMAYVSLLRGREQIWIDVGALEGSETLPYARRHPYITVHAFEPDPSVMDARPAATPNYRLHAQAIAPLDGAVSFYVNAHRGTSSTKRLDAQAVERWDGGETMAETREVRVPAVRLDTFMRRESIPQVAYLKVDAQGADLDVLGSAGERLADVLLIRAEAPVRGRGVYRHGHTEQELVAFLAEHGFRPVRRVLQCYGQEADLLFENRALASRLPGATRAPQEAPAR